MPPTRYRAAEAADMHIAPLDDFTAIYHRPSGLTHLVTAPVPEILTALGDDALSCDALLDRLSATFDLRDGDVASLEARLIELVQIGLAEAV